MSDDVGAANMARRESEGGGWRAYPLFIWAFAGVAAMLFAWSLATPLAAAPDEPSHITQAVAIVHGQFDHPDDHPTVFGPVASVRVPEWTAKLSKVALCYTLDPATSACTGALGDSTTLVTEHTQYSNAPPLYYAVVGIPSLFLTGNSAVYAIRAMGDLVNAALIGLGIWLLLRFHPRRTPLIGVLLALSPMVLFLTSVVNSSGMEIAAGFATWCAAVCVAEYRNVPRALAIWTAVGVAVLILSRPTSPLDAVIVTVVMAVFVGWRELRLRWNPSLRPLMIPTACVLIVAGVFLLIAGEPRLLGYPPKPPASLLANMGTTLRLTGGRLLQCIGNFGWLNLPVPTWILVVWITCLAGLVATALCLSARCRRALPVLVVLLLAMPLALESPQINTVNLYWQGRYWLPVAVGVPLVASTVVWQSSRLGHWAIRAKWPVPAAVLGLGAVLLAAQVVAFDHALRFYQSSLQVAPGVSANWAPPGGDVLVSTLFVLGTVATTALVAVMALSQAANVSFGLRRPAVTPSPLSQPSDLNRAIGPR